MSSYISLLSKVYVFVKQKNKIINRLEFCRDTYNTVEWHCIEYFFCVIICVITRNQPNYIVFDHVNFWEIKNYQLLCVYACVQSVNYYICAKLEKHLKYSKKCFTKKNHSP